LDGDDDDVEGPRARHELVRGDHIDEVRPVRVRDHEAQPAGPDRLRPGLPQQERHPPAGLDEVGAEGPAGGPGTGAEDRRFAVYAACHPSSSFRSGAAAAGSSAEVIARTTTARFAPASRISSRRGPAAIPPMANQGLPASAATSVSSWVPTARQPGLVGVCHTGPTQKYSI